MDIRKKIMQRKHRHKDVIMRIKNNDTAISITIRIIAISILSIISAQMLPISATAKQNIQEYNVLRKISQIDDLAHEQDTILEGMTGAYNKERDRRFHIIDNKYHTAIYKDEKYKTAVELNVLIKEQHTFLYQMIGVGNAFSDLAKKRFDTLQKEFEQLNM